MLILFLIILAIVVIILVENSKGYLATLTIIAVSAIYISVNKIPLLGIWEYITQNFILLGCIAFIYILIGVGYSLVKWYLFCQEYYKRQQSQRSSLGIKSEIKLSALQMESYVSYIVMWISYWPFSLLWMAINRPIRTLANYLSDWYQKISDDLKAKYIS